MTAQDKDPHPAAAPGEPPVPAPRTFARRIDCSPAPGPAVAVPVDDGGDASGEGA